MKRSRIQVIYRYLPGMWVSEKDDDGRSITAEITGWNYRRMENVYISFLESEIRRQIQLFGSRGGNISSFSGMEEGHTFEIVEPALNPQTPDVIGRLSPLLFYCSSCHRVFKAKSPKDPVANSQECQNCGKKSVKQVQLLYSCECGMADPVRPPYIKDVDLFEYRPAENAFAMQYKQQNTLKNIQLSMTCPGCGLQLRPDHIQASRSYKPFTLRMVNLVDRRAGAFFEKGLPAQKVVIAEWFGELTHEEYEAILDNLDTAFSKNTTSDAKRREAENQVRAMIAAGLLAEDKFESAVNTLLGSAAETGNVEKYVRACDRIYGERRSRNAAGYEHWVNSFSFKLMQYNTLHYADRVITLDEAIAHQMKMGLIEDGEEIRRMNRRLGIRSVQVSSDIEIINCAYGFTRRITDPEQARKPGNLKLMSFDRSAENRSLVYSSRLKTEGLLFEVDRGKIIEWLLANRVISEEMMPDTEDENALKKWFSENVNGDLVSTFGGVEEGERITKAVFSLLHSMAHALIKTAGEISGLAETSLTEIIIPETTTIFIYASASQGMTLGALSGMMESSLLMYLKRTFDDNRNCYYDPICTERDNTACSACMLLPETTCGYFNADLGRRFLYTLKEENGRNYIGFWEMPGWQ